jgi:hypothetical protein
MALISTFLPPNPTQLFKKVASPYSDNAPQTH